MKIHFKGVRNPDGAKNSIESVIGESLTKGKLFYEKCDTGDMNSVREFAKKVQERFSAIHVLINNGESFSQWFANILILLLMIHTAGVMATPYKETADGFESQMAINYLGHFLLTHLLLPQLIAGSNDNSDKNVRIVNVSSCVHRICEMNYEDFHCR